MMYFTSWTDLLMDERGERILRGHTAVLLQGAALHKYYALGNTTTSSVHMTCQTSTPPECAVK
jgi:hypothetical protein